LRETLHNSKILSEADILRSWAVATGHSEEIDNLHSKRYLSETLRGKNGVSAKIELYPDFLNNRHRLVIQEFSAIEGDENYLDCLQLVAHAITELINSGLSINIEAPEGYSDGPHIKVDVEALLPRKKKNE